MDNTGAPRVSVILPTYKEEGAIGGTLDGIAAALDSAGIAWEAVVVDDDSPDGTHDAVRRANERHGGRVRLIVRTEERGLASAVVRGFAEARGALLVVMDADGQHPASALVDMIQMAERDTADVVVGSRHIAGGSVGGFSALRRFVSWGAALMARIALPRVRSGKVTDPMSGFFLVRRAAIDGTALDPVGYKILLEVLAKAKPQKGRRLTIREVPYTFGTRTAGESKLGAGVMVDYIRHLIKLGLADRENRRFLEFAIIGGTGVLVNLGIIHVAELQYGIEEGVLAVVVAAIAREAAVAWNFTWNDLITYRDMRRATGYNYLVRFLRFNVVSLTSFAVYLGVFTVLLAAGVDNLIASAIGILVSLFINFRGNTEWTYRHQDDRPVRRKREGRRMRTQSAE